MIKSRVFWTAVIIITIFLGFFFYSYFFGMWSASALQQNERASIPSLYFGTVTLISVVFTLLYNTVQFGKTIARPQLNIVLGTDGARQITIPAYKKLLDKGYQYNAGLQLYIYNSGNKVTDLYNVQFRMPNGLNPTLWTYTRERAGRTYPSVSEGEFSRLEFYSDKLADYVCYVGKYVHIGDLSLKYNDEISIKLNRHIKVTYDIYSDSGVKDTGVLEINLNEQ